MTTMLNLPLAQPVLNRDAVARDGAELFDLLWQEPETRILVLYKGKTLVSDGKLVLFKTDQATAGNSQAGSVDPPSPPGRMQAARRRSVPLQSAGRPRVDEWQSSCP